MDGALRTETENPEGNFLASNSPPRAFPAGQDGNQTGSSQQSERQGLGKELSTRITARDGLGEPFESSVRLSQTKTISKYINMWPGEENNGLK